MDSGLECLILLAKYHSFHADSAQLKHAFAISDKGASVTEILRMAKSLGLKAKSSKVTYETLTKLNFPLILKTVEGNYIIGAQKDLAKGSFLILNPIKQAPEVLSKDDLLKTWSGEVILLSPKGFQFVDQVFDLKWFIPAIWKYRKSLGEVLLASLSMQIIGLGTPIVMQVIIDKVLVHKGLTTLDGLAIGLIILIIFESMLNMARTYIFTNTTNKIDVTLGAKIFKHLFSLPLRYFEVRRVGDTITRVRQVEQIREFLTGAPLTSVLDVMFVVVYLIVMFFYSSSLSWIFIGFLPLFLILSIVVNPLYKSRLDEKFQFGSESNSYLVETVTGVQTIKSFALEPLVQKKWEELLAKYVKSSFKLSVLSGMAGSAAQLIERVTDLVILWLGARFVISGQITIGELIAFRMLSGRVSGPVLRIVQMWQNFQQVGVSINKLGDIFKTKGEPSIDTSKAQLPSIKGHIKIEGVRFRYQPNMPEVIRDMSFEIPPGITVGIVGRSGSGKSTLSKLLQRLYIPETGKILIDGVDISLADPAWLRRQIGVVLQENFLFNGSIRDNICIHAPNASMEEIVNCAKTAGAHDFIVDFPDSYNTPVGERGTSLSGGQRQRVAIARALITNPRILIFDEATSALDYESERIIQNNLKEICKARTVIIIAHRLSTLRSADKIIALDRGVLVEYGSQEELLKTNGLYHYLYKQQEA
ncbi:MAG: type I secretion system permease/ATPase [Lentisphaerota bacterium]